VKEEAERRAKGLLAVGLASLSFAAILVRYAQAPALAIAFWRKALATLLLLPLVLIRLRREPWDWKLQRSLLPYTAGAGVVLAIHFSAWIASIQMTTVASSLLVMSAQPVWAALFAFALLGEPVSRKGGFAIALSLAGIVLIAWGDFGRGPASLWGDLLALVSGVAAAGYLTVGRHLRNRLPLLHYLVTVYGACSAVLGIAAAVYGASLVHGYGTRTWLMFGLLALFPSAIGHSLVNLAIRHIESYRVNLSILVEPVVSTVLAAILFHEVPGLRFYPGAALVLCGVLIALWEPAVREPEVLGG
jgi:drug/metabolite transporter (DMT)-like permease